MSACSSRHNKEATNCLSLSGRHLWFQDPALIINPLVFLSLRCFEKNLFRLSFSRSHDYGTISSTFIIVCIIFIFLTAGRRWRPWWWSMGRCLVRDKQHVIAQFKHFHLNSFITDRTNETFTDHSWSQQHIYIVLDRNCLDQMLYHEVQM